MKKILSGLAFGVLMILATEANAQEQHHGKKHFNRAKTEGHFSQLNLTEDQKEKIKSLRGDYMRQMQELRKNENITVKEMKEKRSAIAKEHKTSLNNLLTDEQKTKLSELRKQSQSKRKNEAGQRRKEVTAQLNLSDSQKEKIKEIHQNYRQKRAEFEKSDAARNNKEAITKLRKEQQEEIRKVYTEEQLQKLKELRHTRTDKDGKR